MFSFPLLIQLYLVVSIYCIVAEPIKKKPSSWDHPSCERACPRNYDPRCASDGQLYANRCAFEIAKCRNESLEHKPCLPKTTEEPNRQGQRKKSLAECEMACTRNLNEKCGSDGQVYGNQCLFKIAKCKNPSLQLVSCRPKPTPKKDEGLRFIAKDWSMPEMPIKLRMARVGELVNIDCRTTIESLPVKLGFKGMVNGRNTGGWVYAGAKFKERITRNNQVFSIRVHSIRDAGEFRCEATNAEGTLRHLQLGMLNVRNIRRPSKPQIIPFRRGEALRVHSGPFKLRCEAPNVDSTLKWWRIIETGSLQEIDPNRVKVTEQIQPGTNKRGDKGTLMRILHFHNFNSVNEGQYACERRIKHTLQTVTQRVNLKMIASSVPAIQIHVYQNQRAKLIRKHQVERPQAGKYFKMSCTSIGSPKPQVEWYLDQKRLEGDDMVRCLDDKSRCFVFYKQIRAEHKGVYYCRARNSVGTTGVEFSVFPQ